MKPLIKISGKEQEVKKINTLPRPYSDKSTVPPPKLIVVEETAEEAREILDAILTGEERMKE